MRKYQLDSYRYRQPPTRRECTGCHELIAGRTFWWDGDFLQVSNTLPEPGETHPYCQECNDRIEKILEDKL